MYGLAPRSRTVPDSRRTRDELRRLGSLVTFTWPTLGTSVEQSWSESLILVSKDLAPWLMGPAECDPLTGGSGRPVLPRPARRRLAEIGALNIPFLRRVAFGHELDPDGPVRELLPALRAGPQSCSAELARQLVGEVPVHPVVAGAVGWLDWAARGPRAEHPATRLAGPGSTHVIFGVGADSPPREGQLCLWFALTAWRW